LDCLFRFIFLILFFFFFFCVVKKIRSSSLLSHSDGLKEKKSNALDARKKAEEELSSSKQHMIMCKEKLDTLINAISDLEARAQQLEETSKLSPEIQAALEALDRRQLSEISKLGKPPAAVQQALEIVWVFIDMFEATTGSEEAEGSSAATADTNGASTPIDTKSPLRSKSPPRAASSPTRDRSLRDKSPPRAASSPTRDRSLGEKSPPRAASSPTRDRSLREKSPPRVASSPTRDRSLREKSPPKGTGSTDVASAKLAQVRTWAEIRKQMAVDLHPHIAAIQVNYIAQDRNESAVRAIKVKIDSLDPTSVSRASKPTGVLYMWCKALVECAISIRAKRPVQEEISSRLNEKPEIESEYTQSLIVVEEKKSLFEEVNARYESAKIEHEDAWKVCSLSYIRVLFILSTTPSYFLSSSSICYTFFFFFHFFFCNNVIQNAHRSMKFL
jgi:hypothetical protein